MKAVTASPIAGARGAKPGIKAAVDAADIPAPIASPAPLIIFCVLLDSFPSSGVESIPVRVGKAKARAVAFPILLLALSIFFCLNLSSALLLLSAFSSGVLDLGVGGLGGLGRGGRLGPFGGV